MERDYYNLGKETEQIEFKKSTGELKEGVISIVSILNKHGSGDLYFGVKNDGTVLGQEINDTTLRAVSQAIGNHISPTVYPEISEETYDGKNVVHVKFSGTQQPYLAYNIPRIRVADEDLVMEQPEYEVRLRRRDNASLSWEHQRSKYKISDIDQNVFKTYLKNAKEIKRITFKDENPKAVMKRLELCDGEWLLNAGAALFVDSGMNELQMAKFASDEKLTFTDIRRYTGSILDLSDKATDYIIDAMDWRVEFDGSLERKEIPEIPVDAVREAVINAFAHRIIESGQSVEVSIFRSFIDITSPGRFPEGLTPQMFIEQPLAPARRNPLIARTLYYSQNMESFATGFKRIQDACDEAGVKVEYRGNNYTFTVRFYRHCGEGWGTSASANNIHGRAQMESNETKNDTNDTSFGGNGGKNGTDGSPNGGNGGGKNGGNGGNISGTDRNLNAIITCMKDDERVSVPEIVRITGIPQRTVERMIRQLKKDNRISREGSNRSGKWVVK